MTKTQLLEEMLEMQDAMNKKVHPDWRNQHFAWYRAIWTECAELMDKIGWKWWKHKVFDKAQFCRANSIDPNVLFVWNDGKTSMPHHGRTT